MTQINSSQVASYILAMAQGGGGVFYCTGPTLSGRTFVCDEIERGVESHTTWHPRMHRHMCKQSDVGHEAVTNALKEFAGADRLTGSKLKAMVKKGWPGILKAGRAIASRALPFVPSEVDLVIDQLASAFSGGDDEKLKAFPKSNVDVLIELLRTATEEASPNGVLLVVDALEDMPAPGVLLITALLRESIRGLAVVVMANSEAASTKQREHAVLTSLLQYKSPDTIIEIVGHNLSEIIDWKGRLGSVKLTPEQAAAAFGASLDGRSGLLAPWMMVSDVGPALIEREHRRLFGQLDLEYSGFAPKVQVAIEVLARCYPDPISTSDLAAEIGASREEMVAIRNQLVSSFVKDEGAGLRLKRMSVFDFVRQRVGPAALSCSWRGTSDRSRIAGNRTELEMIAETTSDRLLTIDRDLRRGAVQVASERIEVALKLSGPDDAERPRLLILRADVHDQRGEYAEAMDCLNEAFVLSSDAAVQLDAKWMMANAQFRLGNAAKSLKELHWMRKHVTGRTAVDISCKAVLRSVSALIELDKTRAAIRIAESAIDKKPKVSPSKSVDCHLTRTAARALVLSSNSQERAEGLANAALALARQGLGERAIGNCLYGLGDVYRHRNKYAAAEQAFHDALTYAATNFDLRLYCNLGLGAAAISALNDVALEESLAELSQLPIADDGPEWEVAALFGRVLVALSNRRPASIAKFLQVNRPFSSKRRWQKELLSLVNDAEALKIDASQFRHGISQIQIVL